MTLRRTLKIWMASSRVGEITSPAITAHIRQFLVLDLR